MEFNGVSRILNTCRVGKRYITNAFINEKCLYIVVFDTFSNVYSNFHFTDFGVCVIDYYTDSNIDVYSTVLT